jgi:hypothetical protein
MTGFWNMEHGTWNMSLVPRPAQKMHTHKQSSDVWRRVGVCLVPALAALWRIEGMEGLDWDLDWDLYNHPAKSNEHALRPRLPTPRARRAPKPLSESERGQNGLRRRRMGSSLAGCRSLSIQRRSHGPPPTVRGLHMHSWLLVLALQVAVGLLAGLSLRLFLPHREAPCFQSIMEVRCAGEGAWPPLLYVVVPLLVCSTTLNHPTNRSSAPLRDFGTWLLRPECPLSPNPADR